MQSLCSAHLEEKHQWGPGLGVEDDLFITNEEWTSYKNGADYTGIPAHVIDLATSKMYATGVFTLGGFEKIVEFNCGHADYVCFSPSGYNGAFNVASSEASRKNALTLRPDGTSYVFPKYVVPSRIYIGVKGKDAKGLPATDFLSRNGLAYGQVYGFATDMATTTGGKYMDDWHKTTALPGATVAGAYYPIDWRWDGEVRSFLYDGSWAFQHKTADGLEFWNSKGRDAGGSKTEHNSPDPYGGARYIQSSTAGYFGIFDLTGVTSLLSAANGGFPSKVPAVYTCLQGEKDITAQIKLGGKGRKANGEYQTTMSDSYSVDEFGVVSDSAKKTFEDIDGFEWIAASGTSNGYVIIQEDGGNDFGERTFISKVETDGTPMTFYFIAMSGGDDNTRTKALVGVPAGTNIGTDAVGGSYPSSAHEFSGVIDISGILAKTAMGSFVISPHDGAAKRNAEKNVAINDKTIVMGLQAHTLAGGIIKEFRGDRGGQLYAYKPQLP